MTTDEREKRLSEIREYTQITGGMNDPLDVQFLLGEIDRLKKERDEFKRKHALMCEVNREDLAVYHKERAIVVAERDELKAELDRIREREALSLQLAEKAANERDELRELVREAHERWPYALPADWLARAKMVIG